MRCPIQHSNTMELQLPTNTGNQLISFNVAALQSMMQAVAREVAEQVSPDAVNIADMHSLMHTRSLSYH